MIDRHQSKQSVAGQSSTIASTLFTFPCVLSPAKGNPSREKPEVVDDPLNPLSLADYTNYRCCMAIDSSTNAVIVVVDAVVGT